MPRPLLDQAHIHPALDEAMTRFGADILREVQAALVAYDIVVVGMRQNPFPGKARKLLDQKGFKYHYLEYGSYLSEWRRRLALKLWTGWPTFPMIFVKGVLVGGYKDLESLIEKGELKP